MAGSPIDGAPACCPAEGGAWLNMGMGIGIGIPPIPGIIPPIPCIPCIPAAMPPPLPPPRDGTGSGPVELPTLMFARWSMRAASAPPSEWPSSTVRGAAASAAGEEQLLATCAIKHTDTIRYSKSRSLYEHLR